MPNDLLGGVGDAKVLKCKPHQCFDLIQATTNVGGESPRSSDKAEEARRIHLIGGKAGEGGDLFGVILGACNDESHSMLGTFARRVGDLVHEGTDQPPGVLVALNEVGSTAHCDGEHERRLRLPLASCADDEIVDRMLRRLLEGHAHHEPTVAQLRGCVPEQEVGEILDADLPLEGHAPAPGGVRAHPLSGHCGAHLASFSLQPGAHHRVVGVEVPTGRPPLLTGQGEPGVPEPP